MKHESQSAFRREPREPVVGGNLFTRSLTARTLARLRRSKAADVAAELWPNDRSLEHLLTRAASNPAMVSVPGWAAELSQRYVSDAIQALGPASSAAQILRKCLVLSFDGYGSISAPGFVAEYGNAGFVAEGQPIPVRQLTTTPAVLDPHKLAAIAVLTREMLESSNAEALISDALVKAAGRMMDEVLFDANPAAANRPAGLRYGVAALPVSTASDGFEAVFEDVAALINSLAPVGGNGPYILVGAPGRAVMMGARFAERSDVDLSIFGSNAVVNDLLAIAPAALVAAISPEPEIETVNAATLVMDTAPGAAGTMGPEKEIWQTDSIAIKVRWPVSWALRDPRAFAWTTPTWK
ncbi:phage major capsid protein [Bradyrhizobium sp. CCGUVB1N3]|uniref:phage major capsid protein n=1 Tax=Bradyrhizobium sp. CCGUVB1N3 TaxID=2949629 RepID=UPI0020B1900F|nr:phage major capsid protein [Bradyrhizobium sp. CCGUVB1N3]MCP3471408.1 phage major capsid protein [Bradyrhizobium sp. CCGUVB1N3]